MNTHATSYPPIRLPALPSLPRWPLFLALRSIPEPLLADAAARVVNRLLGERCADLAALEGRSLSIEGTDVGKRLHFLVAGGKLRRSSTAMTDLHIRGTLADLLRMGLRLEDPDTLFFSRRLRLEGDTATGLSVKNLLDGLDLDWAEACQRLFGPLAGPAVAQGLHRTGVAARLRDRLERTLGRS